MNTYFRVNEVQERLPLLVTSSRPLREYWIEAPDTTGYTEDMARFLARATGREVVVPDALPDNFWVTPLQKLITVKDFMVWTDTPMTRELWEAGARDYGGHANNGRFRTNAPLFDALTPEVFALLLDKTVSLGGWNLTGMFQKEWARRLSGEPPEPFVEPPLPSDDTSIETRFEREPLL